MNMLQTLCIQFVERAEHFEMKGKKRDERAIEFLVGAATALQNTNHEEAQHVLSCVAFIIAVRGYVEVKRIAMDAIEEKEKKERDEFVMPPGRLVCSNGIINV